MSAPRFSTPLTPTRRNFRDEGVKLAQLLSIELMPWQIDAIALLTEMDEHGTFVYRDATVLVGRQVGKTTVALILFLIRCFATPGTRCVLGEQTLKDARSMLLETWLPLLEASPLVDTYTVRAANGSEAILFKNKSSIHLLTTTSTKAGHGQTIDFAILDEAFSQPDARVEQAVLPAMATRSGGLGPQYLVISNAGTLDGKSPYLWDRTERGRQLVADGVTQGSAFIEWSADDKADSSDPATWAAACPALGYTITEEAIRAEFNSMDRPEFERARLCRWTVQHDEPIISIERWTTELQDDTSTIESNLVLALDVAPNRDHASIAAAGKNVDGKWHVEVVESREKTSWVPARLAELQQQHHPLAIVVDALSASLVPEISESLNLTQLQTAEHAAALAYLLEQVQNGTVRHPRDDDLVSALAAATTRSLGDGGMAWSRRGSSVTIDGLVAITLALWSAESQVHAPQVWSIREILAEREQKAQQPIEFLRLPDMDPHQQPAAATEPDKDGIYYLPSGVKVTPIMAMPRRTSALSHIPDQSVCPMDAPSIGTPQPVSSTEAGS